MVFTVGYVCTVRYVQYVDIECEHDRATTDDHRPVNIEI
jgi:hypothetical protein